jgi:hypothetical protein
MSRYYMEGVKETARKLGAACLQVCWAMSAYPPSYVYLLAFVCSSCLSMYPSIRDGVSLCVGVNFPVLTTFLHTVPEIFLTSRILQNV